MGEALGNASMRMLSTLSFLRSCLDDPPCMHAY
jgi:hypothetical protein